MPLVSLVGPRCFAAYKIMKGQSQPPPDGTHLYSDELFPHIQSNPTLMSYSVVNKLADKHKHRRVQTDAHIHRGSHVHMCTHPGPHRQERSHIHTACLAGWDKKKKNKKKQCLCWFTALYCQLKHLFCILN